MPEFTRLLFVCLLSAVVLSGAATNAHAQSFRVETKLFLNDEREPAGETLTLFDNGRVYDFIYDHESGRTAEATVYDVKHAKFYLIDVGREIHSEVTAAELAQFSIAMKQRAEGEDRSVREIVVPRFEVTFDDNTGVLVLDSPRVRYEVKCRKSGVNEARQYNRFADWYARLNATAAGNPPPFARLDLNAELAERDLVPERVARTYKPANRLFGSEQTARTEHVFSWRLLEADRKRMTDVQRYRGQYKAVDFAVYRDVASLAGRAE